MSHSAEQSPNPFQQASDLAHDLHTRYHSHNHLVMSPFGQETGGVVLPIVTTLTYQELPKQGAEIEFHDINVWQRYPELTARATYVGLWPNGNKGSGAAVLYKSQATFTPESFESRIPFRRTMNELLESYTTLAETPDEDIKGGKNPTTHAYLKGAPDTAVVERNAGYNSVEKIHFWRPALSGLVEVNLPYGHILKITDKSLLGAAPKAVSLELPGGDEQKSTDRGYHTLSEGESIVYDEESGEIRFRDAAGAVHAPPHQYGFNPVLVDSAKTIYEQAADQLTWNDITGRVLNQNLTRLYEKAGLTQDVAYDAIQKRALKELEKARRGLKSEPLATAGVATYLEKLHTPDNSRLVTRSYTTLR